MCEIQEVTPPEAGQQPGSLRVGLLEQARDERQISGQEVPTGSVQTSVTRHSESHTWQDSNQTK